ncbi:dihydrodipicolinate synthase family protein [Woeseiaceae bacterium]|jgi:4-hydroxy-tetrahydrodipicolinate synthase|nr:dihydrodipicolinate synthase family protein [Woeseiaceae bacterium]|tara:strand:- start:468 stop:1403 length:936 start_codon:yes stop_codon:yes gene_type:complete
MLYNKLDETAEGVFIISATPFKESGALDKESTKKLIDFYIEKGVHGITILGVMGEAPKLTPGESELFISTVLKQVNQKVPVIVGVSNAGLDNLAKLSNMSMEMGAAGVMVAPPMGIGTETKIYNYFSNVFNALGDDIPVCYQDYPFLTKSEISLETFNRLVNDFNQLVMLKHEEWPGLDKLSKVKASIQDGGIRPISVLTGNGGLYLPQELQRGADGAMTGFAYPEMLVEVYNLHKKGKIDAAEDLFDTYLPLVRYEQQPGFGLAIRKEILFRRGAIDCSKVRDPGPRMSDKDLTELSRIIERVERNLGTN